jgi:hypothetical protein
MAINIDDMTPEEIEAHIQKEVELRSEADELLAKLEEDNFRTKTEKLYYNKLYQAKMLEIDIHLGYADPAGG